MKGVRRGQTSFCAIIVRLIIIMMLESIQAAENEIRNWAGSDFAGMN